MRGALLIVLAMFAMPDSQVTLRIPLQPGEAEEVVVVTFDENRVSKTDVKRWMLLHENAYYATPIGGYYPDCKRRDISRLEDDVKKTEQILDELDPNKFPPELSAVVEYLRKLQSFWLWQAQQELSLLKTGKPLDTEYKGIDLARCEVSPPEECREILTVWHNCVLHIMQKSLGQYPRDQWKAFLDAYGIRERLESTLN